MEDRIILPEPTIGSDPSWFGFPITIRDNFDFDRTKLLKHLDSRQIGTRLLFAGNLTKQPYMRDMQYRVCGDLDNTDLVMNNTFWVGVHPSLTEEMIAFVAEELLSYFGN